MSTKKIVKLLLTVMSFTIVSTISVFAFGWVDDGGENWRYVDADGVWIAPVVYATQQ